MPVTPFLSKSRPNDDLIATISKIMLFRAKVVNMTTLIGPKWAHKQLILISTKDFEGSRGPGGRQEYEQNSEPDRLGGVGGG